ncbi:DUF2007 domain-containing protein [Algoriphagus sp.]|uniref:putative signal transducing protein n=1 Tax=Algoriphagus sp. TaxID=1872435 RepID=UPI0025E9F42F|nr:DUF2007 domain-containing protein [Algoriphagus sp.]
MGNWVKVFESGKQIRAEIVKGVLEENEIKAVVLNKKETVYQIFGTYQVLVLKEDQLLATNIIQNEITF